MKKNYLRPAILMPGTKKKKEIYHEADETEIQGPLLVWKLSKANMSPG